LNIIFYFSGTGNSLKIAKDVLNNIENGELAPMSNFKRNILEQQYDTIGFVFPIYFWGLPNIVIKFIQNNNFSNNTSYYYAIATSGGSPGNGLSQLNELLKNCHNIKLNYGQNLTMQTNYILHNYLIYTYNFHNLNKKAEKILIKAEKNLIQIIGEIKRKENNKIGKIDKYKETYYNNYMQNISLIDKNYIVNNNCIKCGICVKVCPVRNIELISGKPKFKNNCEHCLACMNYCPQKSIDYKNITRNRKRYTNPEISYKELSEKNNL
jgi:ferredoxin/flavodoxin